MNNFGKLFALQKIFIKFIKAWLLADASNQLTTTTKGGVHLVLQNLVRQKTDFIALHGNASRQDPLKLQHNLRWVFSNFFVNLR